MKRFSFARLSRHTKVKVSNTAYGLESLFNKTVLHRTSLGRLGALMRNQHWLGKVMSTCCNTVRWGRRSSSDKEIGRCLSPSFKGDVKRWSRASNR